LGCGYESSGILFHQAFTRKPLIEGTNRRQVPGDRRFAQAVVVKVREEAADADMVYVGRFLVTDVVSEAGEVLGIGKDSVGRGIALAERTKELCHCFRKRPVRLGRRG